MEDLQSHNKIEIKSSLRDYAVTFGDFESSFFREIKKGDAIIIDNKLLDKINIANLDGCIVLPIEASEKAKEYRALSLQIESLIEDGFSRGSKIIAIGGGVVQDIAGFISSIIYRGVEWIFYPTTLLAQGDSCIGGKTSINFGNYKNQVGNFYPPHRIVIDVNFLETLPQDQIDSGLGEMAHYYLIKEGDDLSFFSENHDSPNSRNELIYRCLNIKRKIIEDDEFDTGRRIILNYGHSFGHAIESWSEYQIPHGIAVAHGMDIANFFSWRMGQLTTKEYWEKRRLLENFFGNATHLNLMQVFYRAIDYDCQFYINRLLKDKKSKEGMIGLILFYDDEFTYARYETGLVRDLIEDYAIDQL